MYLDVFYHTLPSEVCLQPIEDQAPGQLDHHIFDYTPLPSLRVS